MKADPLAVLRQQLFDETDGAKFSTLKDKLLKKYAVEQRGAVLQMLTVYARDGRIVHWRTFLLNDIIKLVSAGEYRDFFDWTLTEPALTYWGIDGVLKTAGKSGYDKLVALALCSEQPLATRAKAIKSLAVFSRQPFDRGLPQDPGYWKAGDLQPDALLAWQRDGYSDGAGFAAPVTHPALDDPRSALDKLAARLDKKLAKLRQLDQDLAQPSNWLVVADPADIAQIRQRWTLPDLYLRFLTDFSPLKVFIDHRRYFQGLTLYGAADLMKAQQGYAVEPDGKTIAGWPENYVVIADAGADPFCIDLGNIDNGDAPIFTSMHGAGEWKFERYADGFMAFLKEIAGK